MSIKGFKMIFFYTIFITSCLESPTGNIDQMKNQARIILERIRIERLSPKDSQDKWEKIYSFGYEVGPLLMEQLKKDPNQQFTEGLIVALGKVKFDPAFEELKTVALRNESMTLRSVALIALEQIDHERAFSTIAELAESDGSIYVRLTCIFLLKKYKRVESRSLLLGLLKDKSARIRSKAVSSLQLSMGIDAISYFKEALKTEKDVDVIENLKFCIQLLQEIEETTVKNYSKVKSEIQTNKNDLQKEYLNSNTEVLKKKVIKKARNYIVDSLKNGLFQYWYGTRWGFNGVTDVPKKGEISCGYFVATILRDLGLNVSRFKVGKMPAESIIRLFIEDTSIMSLKNSNLDIVFDWVRNQGHGIYIIGLDFHIGFIVYDTEGIWFIHSSYFHPKVVRKEKAKEALPIINSKYMVLGKLFADDDITKKWLLDIPVAEGD
jgi:hypothetical protein